MTKQPADLTFNPSQTFKPKACRPWFPEREKARNGMLFMAWSLLVLIAVTALFASHSSAHAMRENYIWLNMETDHLGGRFELNIKDIKSKLNIDPDAAGENRLEGVRKTAAEVQAYITENFALYENGEPLSIRFEQTDVFKDGPDFIQYFYRTDQSPKGSVITVRSTLFMAPKFMSSDRLHRSVLVVSHNNRTGNEFGEENVALVFTPDRTEQTLDLAQPPSILTLKDFKRQGVLHILAGPDHVLFLVLLLLTSVLVLTGRQWKPVERFWTAAVKIVIIVTVFSIAHSITFSLAALGYISANTALIETVIAISIIAVALNNIYPRLSAHTWMMVFGFGLFHGLGFASAMSDLQFRNVQIKRILLDFNIGVEVGQIVIVVVLFPILYWLSRWKNYHRAVVVPVSLVSVVVATYWVLERTGLIAA